RRAADSAGAGDSGLLHLLVRPRRAAGRSADAAGRRPVADHAVAGLGPGLGEHGRAVVQGVPPRPAQDADRHRRWHGARRGRPAGWRGRTLPARQGAFSTPDSRHGRMALRGGNRHPGRRARARGIRGRQFSQGHQGSRSTGMNEGLIVAVVLLVFILVTVAKGVRLVAQGEEWVVERLGKYHSTLRPGLNILIPYLDRVAYKLVTKDII